MNVQYDAILAKNSPIICGVIVQMFRCVLINRFRPYDLFEVLRLIYGTAEMREVSRIYVSLCTTQTKEVVLLSMSCSLWKHDGSNHIQAFT